MGLELHAQPPRKTVVQRRVIAGADRLVKLEDRLPVEGLPRPVRGLHLVRQQHVRVQVRVPAAGVEMGELRADQTPCLDLLDAPSTLPGVERVVLGPRERFRDRLVVQRSDQRGRLLVGQRPQNTHTLNRREREIEPRDGLFDLIPFPVDPRDHIGPGGVRVAARLHVERTANLLGQLAPLAHRGTAPLGGKELLLGRCERHENGLVAGVHRERTTQLAHRQRCALAHHLVGVRVQTLAVQSGHLFLGHLEAGGGGLRPQTGQPRPDPAARRGALRGIVIRQRLTRLGGRVVRCHRAHQVLVSSPRVHRSEGHHAPSLEARNPRVYAPPGAGR